ncbi:hypothetical protein TSUD_335330 [Trifolium subterraneum]|uniref:Uncharacterized protein n=1 Tax=Trifolium subterraneum TaxID=3900 RepID=A0A2Z6NKS5_TRISU|nr:hypothetical protein TSUD_335330 [Trifolium subterraneum]
MGMGLSKLMEKSQDCKGPHDRPLIIKGYVPVNIISPEEYKKNAEKKKTAPIKKAGKKQRSCVCNYGFKPMLDNKGISIYQK